MNVNDLLSRLSFAQLSNTEAGNGANGNIRIKRLGKINTYVNEALMRLYTRFILKTRTVIIDTDEGVTEYRLTPEHALSNADPLNEEDRKVFYFILDSKEDPFTGNIISILSVSNELGFDLPLNDPDNPWSVTIPEYNMVEIPRPLQGKGYTITYQARHPEVDCVNRPLQTVEIPPFLEGALQAYIAYLWYSDMNTQEAVANAQKNLQLYEQICNEAIAKDLSASTIASYGTKFSRRGFV